MLLDGRRAVHSRWHDELKDFHPAIVNFQTAVQSVGHNPNDNDEVKTAITTINSWLKGK
jgi:hypothetical protein